MAIVYVGTKTLHWQCKDARTFIAQYCPSMWDDLTCCIMKGKELTACTGSWIGTGGGFYNIGHTLFNAFSIS